MNHSIRTLMTTAALSLGALGAASTANAAPDAHIAVRVTGYEQPHVYVPARPYPGSAPVTVYEDGPRRYAYSDDRRDHRRDRRCGADRWNPNQRYMPGAVVWRNGELYQARRISGEVYNQNSPPEWTPNYWRPVDCR